MMKIARRKIYMKKDLKSHSRDFEALDLCNYGTQIWRRKCAFYVHVITYGMHVGSFSDVLSPKYMLLQDDTGWCPSVMSMGPMSVQF